MNELVELMELIGSSDIEHSDREAGSEFEVAFPGDYREWARRYNTIVLCHELTVFNYLDQVSGVGLEVDDMMAVYEGPRTGFTYERDSVYDARGVALGARESLPLFPNPGGLLIWGESDSGDSYFWDTSKGDPDQWGIVVTDNEGYWQEFDIGFLSFLVKLLKHELVLPASQTVSWPWIPAYQECVGRRDDTLELHTPSRWEGYFREYSKRERASTDVGIVDWVDEFR